MSEPPTPTPIHTRLAQFIAVRDKINAMKDRHKEELAPLTKALAMLNGVLLEHLNTSGGDSVAVRGLGTFYRTIKRSATIADAEVFKAFVREHELFELVDWRANPATVTEYLDAHQALPPGITFRSVAIVGVRADSSAGAPDNPDA